MPPRRSVLANEELARKYRWYPAARAALETGKPFPSMPDFNDVGEIVTRHILRAVTGEVEVKTALEGTDTDAVKTAHEALVEKAQKIGEAVYASQQAESASGAAPEGDAPSADDDVVDAEIVDENEK